MRCGQKTNVVSMKPFDANAERLTASAAGRVFLEALALVDARQTSGHVHSPPQLEIIKTGRTTAALVFRRVRRKTSVHLLVGA